MSRKQAEPRRRARRVDRRPSIEALESRRLLSRPLPIPATLPNVHTVVANQAVYRVQINGPGTLRVQSAGRGQVSLSLLGTTDTSTLKITRTRVGAHFVNSALGVVSINVPSGLLHAVEAAGTADLLGPMSQITSPVDDIALRNLGPNARLNLTGDLATLGANQINLGPNGSILVGGDLTGKVNAGSLQLNGGQFVVAHDLSGTINTGSLVISSGGKLATGGAFGALTVTNDARIDFEGLAPVRHHARGPDRRRHAPGRHGRQGQRRQRPDRPGECRHARHCRRPVLRDPRPDRPAQRRRRSTSPTMAGSPRATCWDRSSSRPTPPSTRAAASAVSRAMAGLNVGQDLTIERDRPHRCRHEHHGPDPDRPRP